MKITQDELIGKDVEVVNARNPSLKGMKGKITDETKNSFVLKTVKGSKRVMKKDADFHFANENITIKGENLAKRPEDRIKP